MMYNNMLSPSIKMFSWIKLNSFFLTVFNLLTHLVCILFFFLGSFLSLCELLMSLALADKCLIIFVVSHRNKSHTQNKYINENSREFQLTAFLEKSFPLNYRASGVCPMYFMFIIWSQSGNHKVLFLWPLCYPSVCNMPFESKWPHNNSVMQFGENWFGKCYPNLVRHTEGCSCVSDSFCGSRTQYPQLHHCPFNEVISRHMGADVAKKTHCDVIVIDAHLPQYPLHNLADGIRITTCIMWRQLSPWRLAPIA